MKKKLIATIIILLVFLFTLIAIGHDFLRPLPPMIYTAISKDGINFSEGIEVMRGSTPSVIKLSNGTFLMYYVNPGEDVIRLATSDDGINFRKIGIVLNKGGLYDKFGAIDPEVIKINETLFVMYYIGKIEDAPTELTTNCLLVAISDDGIHWNKSDKPIIKSKGLCDPAVVRMNNSFRLYFTQDGNLHAIDIAENYSIIRDWGVITSNVLAPFVLRIGEKYRLYFSENKGPFEKNGIYSMESKDGIHFENKTLVIEGYVSPCIVEDDGTYRIYYHTRPVPILVPALDVMIRIFSEIMRLERKFYDIFYSIFC